MQEEPRNNNFFTSMRRDPSIRFAAIMTLSYKNSPGRVSLASMPPTVAAATNTTFGRACASQFSVSAWCRASHYAVDVVALADEKSGEIGPVLASYAGDQSSL